MSPKAVDKLTASLKQNGLGHTANILAKMCYRGPWFTLTSRYPIGTNIYERDWDALLVLDACRVDALEAVADEFDFITDIGSIWSRGSTSQEWMAQTFTGEWRDEIADTIYLVGNGFAKQTFEEGGRPILEFNPLSFPAFDVVDAADFKLLKGIWNAHDDRLGNVPPRYVTDRAIDLGRNESAERLIVHYNQPHTPYLADAIDNDNTPSSLESDPFPPLRCGELSREKAWAMYLDNLRLVLGEVELLLENLNAERVVITADHGEAFGEWGQYGHPNASPLPAVRKVPWAETTASDSHTHTPAEETDETPIDIEDHLADLGYL